MQRWVVGIRLAKVSSPGLSKSWLSLLNNTCTIVVFLGWRIKFISPSQCYLTNNFITVDLFVRDILFTLGN